jgi:hypothetical protein
MQVANYLGLTLNAEEQLADAFQSVGNRHTTEIDVLQTCKLFSSWSLDHAENLKPFIKQYGEKKEDEASALSDALFEKRMGALGLLRDLQALWLMTCEVEICYKVLLKAAPALRDKELELGCRQFLEQTLRQKAWLLTRISHSASQTLVVANT